MVVENFRVNVDIQQAKPNRPAGEAKTASGIEAQNVGDAPENFHEQQVRGPDGIEQRRKFRQVCV